MIILLKKGKTIVEMFSLIDEENRFIVKIIIVVFVMINYVFITI